MNNVFQIAQFTRPLPIVTLLCCVRPKPITVDVNGDFLTVQFKCVAIANDVSHLLKGIDQSIQPMSLLGAFGPKIAAFAIPLPFSGFVACGVGDAIVNARFLTFGAVPYRPLVSGKWLQGGDADPSYPVALFQTPVEPCLRH